MTIARRLMVLLGVPLVALLGLGLFTRLQLRNLEERSRFVTESRIAAVATLGNLSRSFAEMRVNVRSYLLATNEAQRAAARQAFDVDEREVGRLLREYADRYVVGDRDRRLLMQYHALGMEWLTGARQVMALAGQGRRNDAVALLMGRVAELGGRLSEVSGEWIQHNQGGAANAGREAVAAIERFKLEMLLANTTAVLLTGLLGFFTFRRIFPPIQALEASVKCIAAGDYSKDVPFASASDETGSLARSIGVLKEGAAALDQQRWVKASASNVTAALHGAASIEEFGQRLVSGLVPLLGGGVAGFYFFDEPRGELRRMAAYGLAGGARLADTFSLGQGLVGQCAQERRRVALSSLPPDYLRIASGLGAAAPVQAVAAPLLSKDTLLGVLEVATFRPFHGKEQALLEELLPVVALSLEVLQRNLRTQELLAQTQEQARQLEEQTDELTQSQEELLAQKEALLAQREQLEASEERSRLILESSAEGIFGTDNEGRITFVNAAACRMLGFAVEELLGQPSHAAFHHRRPDGSEYPKEECPMYAAYAHGRASRIDTEFLWRKDGSGLPVEYGATPMVKDGAVIGSVVSFTDITERVRQAAELKRINFMSDQALDLTKAGYWHVPLDGSGWYNSSERAARIFGDPPTPDHRYTLEHWLKHVYLGDEAAGQVTAKNFEDAVAGRVPFYDATYAYQRPVDGRVVWIHALGHIVRDASGKPTDMFGVTQDITDFKVLEQEILAAKAKAEEATQMKSMFLANMSHEIRTPMNAIIGLSHLALKTHLTPKQRDYVSKVHNAGTSLLAIINDILDFSKIEAGKLEIETTDFQLDEVIGSVTTVTAQKAHDKGLEFLADVASAIPEQLRGDPLRLGQILTNLVNNAIKFTERGEIRLEIELLEQTGEKAQLKFAVRDTGIGMTKDQAARLFQPFSQADMSTTRKHGGTGLGLTICRRLVELMGGQIWLESEPGVGSTFAFTVWMGVGQAVGAGTRVPSQFQNLRVLVVDDNAAAREILVESLEPLAQQVDAVSSGHEALAAVKERDADAPYDVVFMDWRMPGMDGLQAARLIKNDSALRRQPAIIIVTAFGREEVREEAEKLHLEGFLVKPVTKSMLVDSLVSVFAAGTDPAAGLAAPALEETDRLRGLRVLLVEDNEINQQIAVELLEGVGASVVVANHGREAVDRLVRGPIPPPFDVVLMDLQMPVMDGYQATTRIRADARFRDLPILAMTAHATIEERQRCLEAGMHDHVAKPIDPALLFATLERFYKPAQPHAPVEPEAVSAPPPSDEARPEASSPTPAGGPPAAEAPRAAAPPPAEPLALPSVDGLDTQDGLSRVAGNRKLYLKLLRQFIDQQGTAPAQIREALARQDAPLAERLAHTAKGLAGSLGARDLQQVAARLEKAIAARAGSSDVEPVLEEFRDALEGFVERLGAALPSPAAPPAAPTPTSALDPAEARRVLAEMTALLNNFDPAAADCLEAHRAVFEALLEGEAFAGFAQAVSGFDCADALARLERAASTSSLLAP